MTTDSWTTETVQVTRSGPVRHVLLNRPDSGNLLDSTLIDSLHQILDEAEAGDGCSVVTLRARGLHFCRGMPLDPEGFPFDWTGTQPPPPWLLFRRIATCQVPVVAVVEGQATGGGVGLSAACDLVIAGPRAHWRLTEALLGLVPAMALPFIARRVGASRALAWTLTAQRVGAGRAYETGLADLCASDPDETLRALLPALRRLPPGTVPALKAYQDVAFPWPAHLGQVAGRTFAERLHAPETVQRLQALHEEKLL